MHNRTYQLPDHVADHSADLAAGPDGLLPNMDDQGLPEKEEDAVKSEIFSLSLGPVSLYLRLPVRILMWGHDVSLPSALWEAWAPPVSYPPPLHPFLSLA